MADRTRGVDMGDTTTCQWVRDRLPLFVEERDELAGDQGDLGTEDRVQIERHLDDCSACRARRSALADVISILSLVATASPDGSEPPSILRGLNDQIRRHHQHQARQARSPWFRAWRALGVLPLLGPRALPRRAFASLRCELPLQIAWLRDSLQEFLTERPARLRAAQRNAPPAWPRLPDFRPNLGVGLTMAGLCLFAFLLTGFVRHRQIEAEARIASNALPIPGIDAPGESLKTPLDSLAAEQPAITSIDRDRDLEPDRVETTSTEPLAMALASPSPSPANGAQPPAGKSLATLNPVVVSPTSTTAASTKTPAPRYDFDLEHGTPMPPETRGGKPAY